MFPPTPMSPPPWKTLTLKCKVASLITAFHHLAPNEAVPDHLASEVDQLKIALDEVSQAVSCRDLLLEDSGKEIIGFRLEIIRLKEKLVEYENRFKQLSAQSTENRLKVERLENLLKTPGTSFATLPEPASQQTTLQSPPGSSSPMDVPHERLATSGFPPYPGT